ncbi:MAG TPA: hypothetical protein VEB43_16745 [Anaeromyxobacter sp.]|nr:hypothetical protein [Anaeromyxobacter sp.]
MTTRHFDVPIHSCAAARTARQAALKTWRTSAGRRTAHSFRAHICASSSASTARLSSMTFIVSALAIHASMKAGEEQRATSRACSYPSRPSRMARRRAG